MKEVNEHKGSILRAVLLVAAIALVFATFLPGIFSNLAVAQERLEITMRTGNFYYNPNTIKVDEVGVVVNLTIINDDLAVDHTFTIGSPYNIDVEIPGGATVYVEFTADNKGTFDFYCTKQGHRAAGQVGELSVAQEEEPPALGIELLIVLIVIIAVVVLLAVWMMRRSKKD